MPSGDGSPANKTPEAGQLLAFELGDEALEAEILAGMQASEVQLMAELSKGADFLVDKISHLAKAGGKRFRPMYSLIAAQFGDNPHSNDVIRSAVVVELTHLATLYHDDVMDEADMRRGVESANARWDNSVAILAGDYIFSVCSAMLSGLGSYTLDHFATTFGDLVTGQMRETLGAPEGTDPVDHYMQVIREKTGVLISTAGRLGAYHAGAPAEYVEALSNYGMCVGLVFQIVDDMIDIYSDMDQSGKTPGTDLREGVFTLPVLLAMRQQDEVGARLREMLTGPLETDAEVEEALELLARSEGRELCLGMVRQLLEDAKSELAVLPDGAAKNALRNLTEYTTRRVG